jgi:hypothetical protein
MSIHRREFLSSLGAASFTTRLPSGASGSPMAPIAATWDVSWVERVKGKYRGVFDSPEFSDGLGLFRAVFWGRQYKEVYGTALEEMSPVLVVRHEAIWLAMNDEFWKKYNVGERKKFKTENGSFYDRNPIATNNPEMPPGLNDISLPAFIEANGIVLACHLAFRDVIDAVKKDDQLNDEDAESRARTYLFPGVILQPSGVFAVLRAQEAGCNYILAS